MCIINYHSFIYILIWCALMCWQLYLYKRTWHERSAITFSIHLIPSTLDLLTLKLLGVAMMIMSKAAPGMKGKKLAARSSLPHAPPARVLRTTTLQSLPLCRRTSKWKLMSLPEGPSCRLMVNLAKWGRSLWCWQFLSFNDNNNDNNNNNGHLARLI